MSKEPIKFTDIVNERSTAKFTCTLKDEDGTAIPAASIDTMTMTLFDVPTETIVNSRNGQNILNTNNCTVNSSGVFTWNIQSADTLLVNQTLDYEIHRAEIHVSYNSGAGESYFDIDLNIRNMTKVTA